jgi:hypothetical protein
MFIHFEFDANGQRDNCGTSGTLMHLSCIFFDGGLDLCRDCFGTLARALELAITKLQIETNPALKTLPLICGLKKKRVFYRHSRA